MFSGEIAAAYTMDRERDMDFFWVSWFERLRGSDDDFLLLQKDVGLFLVEETAGTIQLPKIFFG